jgi:hypothetical protein
MTEKSLNWTSYSSRSLVQTPGLENKNRINVAQTRIPNPKTKKETKTRKLKTNSALKNKKQKKNKS